MLLKGKTKQRAWGWLQKKDQVSEDKETRKTAFNALKLLIMLL